jgi:hypothetical protein
MLRPSECVLLVEVAELHPSPHPLRFTEANVVPFEQHEPGPAMVACGGSAQFSILNSKLRDNGGGWHDNDFGDVQPRARVDALCNELSALLRVELQFVVGGFVQ